MGLNSIDADLKIGLMTSQNLFNFDKWRSTASRTSEVPQVQNILKSYDTNQDYKIVMNCLA